MFVKLYDGDLLNVSNVFLINRSSDKDGLNVRFWLNITSIGGFTIRHSFGNEGIRDMDYDKIVKAIKGGKDDI
jgi:hypothetical protein